MTQPIAKAKRVLVVDDNRTVRTIVREVLEMRNNIVCDEAENGLDAVQKARESKPDLVIMDWAMPVMNGFEAAVALRREMPEVPVVVLTMYDEPMELARTACVKAVIPKSDDITALVECVQNILGVTPKNPEPWRPRPSTL